MEEVEKDIEFIISNFLFSRGQALLSLLFTYTQLKLEHLSEVVQQD